MTHETFRSYVVNRGCGKAVETVDFYWDAFMGERT